MFYVLLGPVGPSVAVHRETGRIRGSLSPWLLSLSTLTHSALHYVFFSLVSFFFFFFFFHVHPWNEVLKKNTSHCFLAWEYTASKLEKVINSKKLWRLRKALFFKGEGGWTCHLTALVHGDTMAASVPQTDWDVGLGAVEGTESSTLI